MNAHALEIKKLGKNFKKGSKTKVAYAYQSQGNYSTVCCVIKNLSRLTSLIFIDSSSGELIANSRFSARVLLCCTALCADAKKKNKSCISFPMISQPVQSSSGCVFVLVLRLCGIVYT